MSARHPMLTRAPLMTLGLLLASCAATEPEDHAHLVYLSAQVDADGDGVPGTEDCDDGDAGRRPGAPEVPYDGIDQDCDGADLTDVDGDGQSAAAAGGEDCNDAAPEIFRGASEISNDGIDQDCDGEDRVDRDLDGFPLNLEQDCDDNNPSAWPGAPELIDGHDNDCDGQLDEAPFMGVLEADQSDRVIEGEAGMAWSGVGLRIVPDLNQDGVAELLVGSVGTSRVRLFPGSRSRWSSNGYIPVQATFAGMPNDGTGSVAEVVGDMNGDGWSELAFGAPWALGGPGQVYLLRGEPFSEGATILLDQQAIRLEGAVAGDALGSLLLGNLDANGDGLADLWVGAPGVDRDDATDVGSLYLYLGRSASASSSGTLATLSSARVSGCQDSDGVGTAAALSDLRGDGRPDLIVGAPGGVGSFSTHAGQVALLPDGGPAEGDYALCSAGLRLMDDSPTAAGAAFGVALAGGCDLDGDGREDLLVGAPNAGPTSLNGQGRVLIFSGAQLPAEGAVAASTAAGSIWGGAAGDLTGSQLACARDLNGDGYDDALIGAPGANGWRGSVYVLYGRPGGWPREGSALQDLPRVQGSHALGQLGLGLSAGDLDGDGASDLALGAPYEDGQQAESTGKSYLFFGRLTALE